MLLSIIIVILVFTPLCMIADKFITYGKENDLYIKGYLKEN